MIGHSKGLSSLGIAGLRLNSAPPSPPPTITRCLLWWVGHETPASPHLPSFVACHPAAAYNLPGGVPKWTLGFPFSGGLGDAPCRRRQQNARRTSGIVKITQASPFQGVWGIPPAAGGKRLKKQKAFARPPRAPRPLFRLTFTALKLYHLPRSKLCGVTEGP